MGKFAARLTDMTAHGSPLFPGPPSKDVLIGGLPAWLGMTAAAAAALAMTVAAEVEKVAKAAAAVAAAPDPTTKGAATAKLVEAQKEMVTNVCNAMTGGGALSLNICPLFPLPHVQGVVITPSQTVIINKWGACRVGDTIQEATAVNSIVIGHPTVLIGG